MYLVKETLFAISLPIYGYGFLSFYGWFARMSHPFFFTWLMVSSFRIWDTLIAWSGFTISKLPYFLSLCLVWVFAYYICVSVYGFPSLRSWLWLWLWPRLWFMVALIYLCKVNLGKTALSFAALSLGVSFMVHFYTSLVHKDWFYLNLRLPYTILL